MLQTALDRVGLVLTATLLVLLLAWLLFHPLVVVVLQGVLVLLCAGWRAQMIRHAN
jgi:hypothetical protein